MIALLRGVVVEKGIDHVLVDVNGVGYRVAVSLNTLAALPPVGNTATLHTELIVREDSLSLVGFATVDERAAFDLVTGVQGIGPKLAMSILSTMEAGELARAVRDGDHARLVRIPGIGKKTAERLVLELRDKFAPTQAAAPKVAASSTVSSALVNLGYKPAEAERAAAEAQKAHPAAGVADLVKAALRTLAE
ncbi:MAG TPA: Holliday junction branch migration protein RuvA [Polyangia bacterium]|nr:Holliday junction branch migration protein RuvA [Polyangia bacterium]